MDPGRGPAAADLLAARSHVRYRQRRHCRSQSAHLFLRYRYRLLAPNSRYLIHGVGLVVAISSLDIRLVYLGFFLYGTGLAGSFVLREVIWANFFGRASLGKVRGLSLFFSHLFAASGAPFFGFLHDRMGSYNLSFAIFACALFTSALLILLAKPPLKHSAMVHGSK